MPCLHAATFNIRHGMGMDGRLDLSRTAAAIRALCCDVLALQEVDVSTTRAAGMDQAAELGRLAGMAVRFGAAMPFAGGHYGNAVLSRLPLGPARVIPLPGCEPRCVLAVDVSWEGGDYAFLATHLDLDADSRLASLPALADLAGKELAGRPFLLAGDFNAAADDPVTRGLCRQWRADACLARQPTYPADSPTVCIDHILCGPPGCWQVRRVEVIPESEASDHRPVRMALARE